MSHERVSRDDGPMKKGELEELRGAVSALRAQLDRGLGRPTGSASAPTSEGLAARVSEFGRAVRHRVEALDLMELFAELRRRLVWLPAHGFEPEVDDFGVDSLTLSRAEGLLDFLFERWWRVQVSGCERIPIDARLLFVANRSGVLPYDGLMISHAVAREFGGERRPRFLIADWLASLPFAQPFLAKVGGVRACADNAERLLRSGQGVIAFPEGQKGALKLFHDRYRLQRFARGGFRRAPDETAGSSTWFPPPQARRGCRCRVDRR